MSELENENGDAADSHMRVPENSRNVEINGSRRCDVAQSLIIVR